MPLQVGLSQLYQHNFEHNRMAKAFSIMHRIIGKDFVQCTLFQRHPHFGRNSEFFTEYAMTVLSNCVIMQ